jgi:DNA-binding NarL/FixJ family response regulator
MMKVFVADDQPAVRSALRRLLSEETSLGVIGEAARVGDLMEKAQTVLPDLILLDWELSGLPSIKSNDQDLPDSQGWAEENARRLTINALHSLCSHPKIIVLSGRPEVRPKALEAGADAFVAKTDPPESLIDAIQRLCPSQEKSK